MKPKRAAFALPALILLAFPAALRADVKNVWVGVNGAT